MTRERAYWRVTFARADRPVTMSGLSGERFDEFVAGNVALTSIDSYGIIRFVFA
jgi:hypothetical protein